MIELFAAGTPNGMKAAIALEWMRLPYTLTKISLRGNEERPSGFGAASPIGKIPAIRDADTGVSISESGAILVYLAEKAGSDLLPSEAKSRATVLQWLFIATSTIGPALSQAHHYLHFNKGKAPYAEERTGAEANRFYKVLEERLAGNDFLAGDQASIADIAIWPFLIRADWQGVKLGDYPAVMRWYERMRAMPACVAGYQKLQGSTDIPVPA